MLRLALLLPAILLGGCTPGPWELLLIFGIVVLLFGASRLPELGKALGKTVKGFKEGAKEAREAMQEDERPAGQIAGRDVARIPATEVHDAEVEPARREREPEPARRPAEGRDSGTSGGQQA